MRKNRVSVVMNVVPAAMDQEYALAVELKHGPKVLLSVFKSYPVTSTLNQVFASMHPPENLTILKVEVSKRKTCPWLQVEAKEWVQMLVNW